mmetsp:Transcript_105446/g.295445  ORF Transcript_105446/g.295445 Transcript_105446/m.295445 type:complete len:226 (-) Transcript_105446:1-678(-)
MVSKCVKFLVSIFPTFTIREPTWAPAFLAGPPTSTVRTTVRSNTFSTVRPNISRSMRTVYSPFAQMMFSPGPSSSSVFFPPFRFFPKTDANVFLLKAGRFILNIFENMELEFLSSSNSSLCDWSRFESKSVVFVVPSTESGSSLSSSSVSRSPVHARKNSSVASPGREMQRGKRSGTTFGVSMSSTSESSKDALESCSAIVGSIFDRLSYAVSTLLRSKPTRSHA